MGIIDNIKRNVGDTSAIKKKMTEIKRAFFVWNLISVAFYTAFSLVVIITMWGNSVYLWVVTGISLFYILTFGVIILLSRKNKKRLQGQVKDYKSGIKILRSLLRIVAFSLNVTAFVGIFGEEKSVAIKIFAYVSLYIAVFKIIKEGIALFRRHKKKFKGYNGIKAVIFDLDGTLVNSLEDIAIATNYALKEAGLPTRTVEEIRSFIGDGANALIKRAVAPNFDKIDEVYAHYRRYYDAHLVDKSVAYDGVDQLLKWLYYRGIKTAVVSNKNDILSKKIVRKVFFRKIVEVVGVSEQIKEKPALDGINKALRDLRVRADDVIYVGDSEVDYQTAKNGKIKFIGAGWGFGTITSDCVKLENPDQVVGAIEKKNKRLLFLPYR